MQALQMPLQTSLQQTPVTQFPLEHSRLAEQSSPLSSSSTVVVVTVVVVVVLTRTTVVGCARSHAAPLVSVQAVVVMMNVVSAAPPWNRQNASAEPGAIPLGFEMWIVS